MQAFLYNEKGYHCAKVVCGLVSVITKRFRTSERAERYLSENYGGIEPKRL